MAHTIERVRPSAGSILDRLRDAGLQGLAALARAWESRRALQDLGAFDDRMLADVGLSRADLRDAVAQPLWSDPTALLSKRRRERRATRWRPAAALSGESFDAPPLVPGDDACERIAPADRGDWGPKAAA